MTDADPQRPGLAAAERVQVGLRSGQAGGDRLRVREQEPTGLRERHGAGAAGPFHEPLPDDSLQHRDLLADRRLRIAERDRRLAEGSRARDGLERQEMPQFDPEPAIRFHNRKPL